MPTVKEIAAAIEKIAPRELAGDWDNVGALVDNGGEVSSVLVSLDITDDVVNEAEQAGCQLIVAHHPVIFHPLKSLVYGSTVYRMVKKGISAVCAHTNLDAAAGGVNDILAGIFGIAEAEVFAGFGRVGNLREEATPLQLAQKCSKKFGAHVKLADAGRTVRRLAVLGGSGGGLLEEALAAEADCILTGEADHHDAIDSVHAGVSLIVAGHFHTEFPVVPVLAGWLAKQYPGVKVQLSRRNCDPFRHIVPPEAPRIVVQKDDLGRGEDKKQPDTQGEGEA